MISPPQQDPTGGSAGEEAAGETPEATVPLEDSAPDPDIFELAGEDEAAEPDQARPSLYGPGLDIAAVSPTAIERSDMSVEMSERVDALQARITELESGRVAPACWP